VQHGRRGLVERRGLAPPFSIITLAHAAKWQENLSLTSAAELGGASGLCPISVPFPEILAASSGQIAGVLASRNQRR